MKRGIPSAIIVIAAALLVWTAWFWRPVTPEGDVHRVLPIAPQPVGGDFRLRSVDGPFDLAELRGQVVLVYFGYTWCPDICPTNLVVIARALELLTPTERDRVQVLFITVDPQRDTAERLAEYVGWFHPDIIGLTGGEAEIAVVARRYGAAFRRYESSDSAMGYMVDHSAASYLVDPEGHLALTLAHATPAVDIAAAIRSLLPASGP
ncbi:uncharacterized protein SCO1/SenC/PrrC, involved in biogenesis of respiratory and photosynthetic systems [Thioflavicoccus mobilis 8321]|uniref:Uncharacterized protein SCO1/SenC/PrrC, involved in biogenesis of respiratory and photosynthetic systems n=1 Tax=Thioflavicoccus mobilis 8321 TaxID=765912 RepID=U3GK56_9GAMM|nr:SCO family protein [Thioflavicoccus mobilis]AGA89302.1 uncharacterized protein SCO1/SenC/PrrC, involved in biogenesis of respiratory and photosynthetic systems [Thioflavicoccus mobilis 8321]